MRVQEIIDVGFIDLEPRSAKVLSRKARIRTDPVTKPTSKAGTFIPIKTEDNITKYSASLDAINIETRVINWKCLVCKDQMLQSEFETLSTSQRSQIGPTNRTSINAHIYATTTRRYASSRIESFGRMMSRKTLHATRAYARRNSRVMVKLILTVKSKGGEGSEVSENGKRPLGEAVEIPSDKKSRPNKETGKKAVPKKAVAKKPHASKEAYGKAKASAEAGSSTTSALPELDRTFDRKAVLQALRNKLPAALEEAYDRYIAKIDAKIERRDAAVLREA